jgi:rhamnosyl/mannosyltransferase
MNLKVLHVYRTYLPDPPGGVQEVIKQICLATSFLNTANTIYALSPNPNPKTLNRPEGVVVRCRSLVAPASCDLGGFEAFKNFAYQASSNDIIHYHFPWPFADLLHLIKNIKTPAVLTYHSDIVRQRMLNVLYAPLMWRMLKSMKVIVATSPNYARTSPVLNHPDIRNKVRTIPLGIDENSYPLNGDDAIFEKLKLYDNEPYFLFIGVPRYYKGVHALIKAARLINSKIVIAGAGGELDDLKALASELSLNNVIFAGFVSDAEKVSLIKSCCALVLPSHLRSEAFGMVLIEAAMFGRPMISCEIGTGTSYVNANEETGFVVSPECPTELAHAMQALLKDTALNYKFGVAARLRYIKYFSGEALGQAYSEIYQEILV